MKINSQLFEGRYLQISAIDPDQDPQVEVNWTYDLDYSQEIMPDGPAHPLTLFEMKKQYEEWQKGAEEKRDQFNFGFHLREAKVAAARKRAQQAVPLQLNITHFWGKANFGGRIFF